MPLAGKVAQAFSLCRLCKDARSATSRRCPQLNQAPLRLARLCFSWRRLNACTTLAACVAATASLATGASSFIEQERKWRAAYEADLRAPDGWLSVAGLFWLHEGANTVGSDPHSDVKLPAGAPAHAGIFRLQRGTVAYFAGHGAETVMQPDTSGHPSVIHVGDLSLTVIRRADRTGIRLRDPNAAARRDFKGTRWFPPDPAWRIAARWIPFPKPRKIPITNILDMTTSEDCPGYAQWKQDGKLLSLEPLVEDGLLFFMFRDLTNGKTTYAAGRFLYADQPKNGQVILDFNRAHNPPCAFTPHATCPLPPRQNHLRIAVTAGEEMDGYHPG